MLTRKLTAIGSAAMAVLVLGASPATADPPFPELPDRAFHSYCFSTNPSRSPNQEIVDRVRLAMATVEYQTVVATDENGCGAHTDVLVDQGFIAEGVGGYTHCFLWSESGLCDRFSVTIGWGEIRQYADNRANEVRHTACHEIGHTLGLSHYDSAPSYAPSPDGAGNHSCMRSGVRDTAVWSNWSYGSHHISSHINPHWS